MPNDDLTPLDRLVEAARLKHNTRLPLSAQSEFVGEWVVIPKEDFDALRQALAAFEAAEPDAYEITLHLTGSRYADVNPVHAEDFRNRGDATVRDLFARSRHE